MEIPLQNSGESDNSDQAATLTQHSTYYSLDEFVVLKVENVLYRILKSVLTVQSKLFGDMFTPRFTTIIKDNKEGSSNSSPIVFEQVLQVDFDRLLSLITTHSLHTTVTKTWTSDDWISVLDLADKWQMLKVKQLALDSLGSSAQPQVKIMLGKRFKDKQLIKAGLVDICSRDTSITESEATEIGLEATLKCVGIREALWRDIFMSKGSNSNHTYPLVKYSETAKIYAATYVEETFSSGILQVTTESHTLRPLSPCFSLSP